jgi:hypothetical protein
MNKLKTAIYGSLIVALGLGIYAKVEQHKEHMQRMESDTMYARIVNQLDSVNNESAEWYRFIMAKKMDYMPFDSSMIKQSDASFADTAIHNLFRQYDATLDSLEAEANTHLAGLERTRDSLQEVLDQY